MPQPPVVNESLNFVYATDESDKIEIWLMERGLERQITFSTSQNNWWPRLSPDQSKLLYYRTPVEETFDDFEKTSLWLMDMNNSEDIPLFESGANRWKFQAGANWSPDGGSIVFAAASEETGIWQIYTCDSLGENLKRLPTRTNVDFLDPVFSHDGLSIIYSAIPEGAADEGHNFEIHEFELNTGEETRITYNETRDQHPCLSPDGNRIVFESLVDPEYLGIGKWALKEVNLSESKELTLLDDDNLNFYPRYTPDGESIYFVRLNVLQLHTGIYTLPNGANKPTALINKDGNAFNIDPIPAP